MVIVLVVYLIFFQQDFFHLLTIFFFFLQVFSDADIVMASKNEFVPPITVAPTNYLTELEQQSGDDAAISGAMLAAAPTSRKKTSSVSFSVDDEGKEGKENKEDDADKQESRKNKVCPFKELGNFLIASLFSLESNHLLFYN